MTARQAGLIDSLRSCENATGDALARAENGQSHWKGK